jgi:hypothetical protein
MLIMASAFFRLWLTFGPYNAQPREGANLPARGYPTRASELDAGLDSRAREHVGELPPR